MILFFLAFILYFNFHIRSWYCEKVGRYVSDDSSLKTYHENIMHATVHYIRYMLLKSNDYDGTEYQRQRQ